MRAFSPKRLLQTLGEARVELVVIGMGAAVLQGAPAQTFDSDVVHARTEENVARILGWLGQHGGRYRGGPRGLAPTAAHLIGPGHQLLETDLGPIDFMGAVGPPEALLDHAALVRRCVLMDLGGFQVRLLDLEAIVELKRAIGRPKDLAALPLLDATLRARGKRR
ncbi:MAG: hypothetical protein HZB56_02840 [Deltaproteobacteria bacterium]|nr:hypothetical protein [Deltaproteobacteria bacterium]